MRKIMALCLLLAATAAWPQVSDQTLTELLAILQEYKAISLELDSQLLILGERLDASEKSTSALSVSFEDYRREVDVVIRKQDREILFLKIGIGAAFVAVVVEGIALLVRR